MTEEKISPWQAALLMAGFFLGTAIAMNPAVENGPDSWFSMLISISAGLIIVGITSALATLHPGKSLVQILIFCFGKVGGRIMSLFFLLLSVWLASAVLLTFSFYSINVSYTNTPVLFLSICFMVVIVFVVKLGLEVLSRVSEVSIMIIIIITLVTLMSFKTSFYPGAILPLFKGGLKKPLLDGLLSSPFPYAEFFLALTILPNVNDQKKVRSVGRNAVLIAGGLMYIMVMRNIFVLGADVTARNVYPSEKVFQLMPVLNILPLLDINVILCGAIKIGLVLYAEAKILGDLVGTKDFKIFILPLAAMDVAGSVFIDDNILSQLFVAAKIVPLAFIPILIIMPLIMLIISLIRKKLPGAGSPTLK